jgi:hypothetical protein
MTYCIRSRALQRKPHLSALHCNHYFVAILSFRLVSFYLSMTTPISSLCLTVHSFHLRDLSILSALSLSSPPALDPSLRLTELHSPFRIPPHDQNTLQQWPKAIFKLSMRLALTVVEIHVRLARELGVQDEIIALGAGVWACRASGKGEDVGFGVLGV